MTSINEIAGKLSHGYHFLRRLSSLQKLDPPPDQNTSLFPPGHLSSSSVTPRQNHPVAVLDNPFPQDRGGNEGGAQARNLTFL